jgi:pyruvate,water dikinase
MSKELVFGLAEASNLGAAGGKAHALGRMIQAGFNIPKGFVVSTAAFMSMTPALQSRLLEWFDQLQVDFVAVRSSAVNEDGHDAAWAGQLDTFLNVQRDGLLEAIQQCWQSNTSDRARSYAKQKQLTSGPVAVIVQAMIQSEVSGVAFSRHPVTQSNDHIVIEAGLGLGEAIVSGLITPDNYIVEKNSGNIVEKYISTQTKKFILGENNKNMWQILDNEGAKQKLPDNLITQLVANVAELERFYNFPVDVEWAVHNNQLYILQSRPITALS